VASSSAIISVGVALPLQRRRVGETGDTLGVGAGFLKGDREGESGPRQELGVALGLRCGFQGSQRVIEQGERVLVLAEIDQRFGPEAAGLVDALSEDPSIAGYADRKRALRAQVLAAGHGPVLIYAADRVANLRDWLKVLPSDREGIADRLGTTLDERLSLWGEDLEVLTGFDSDLPFLGEIEVALRELRSGVAEAA
jgi:hypothetical protein